MATYTSHLNLKLPDYSDMADIKDMNDNFKKIDDAIASGGTGGGNGGCIVTETDPTVPSWAKQPQKPTYTADEVGALPNTTVIPTVPNALPNPQPIVINGISYDGSERKEITVTSGDGGSITETDPTVPAWAKAEKKPSYTAEEVGALPSNYEPPVTSVNGKTGAVTLVASDVGALPNTTVIPTVPNSLPNPYALTINGQSYDGSEPVSVTVSSGGGAADSVAWEDVTGKPTAYPPEAHTHSLSSLGALGKNDTAADSNKLNGKIADQYALKTDLPTKADDVGALPSDGTAADSSKLGGVAASSYALKTDLTDEQTARASADQALANDIGDAWVSGKTYAVGDYCISGNQLYKCKTAHTAGGAFDAVYWDKAIASSEISSVRNMIESNYPIGPGIEIVRGNTLENNGLTFNLRDNVNSGFVFIASQRNMATCYINRNGTFNYSITTSQSDINKLSNSSFKLNTGTYSGFYFIVVQNVFEIS